jgi:hypothetical protein
VAIDEAIFDALCMDAYMHGLGVYRPPDQTGASRREERIDIFDDVETCYTICVFGSIRSVAYVREIYWLAASEPLT